MAKKNELKKDEFAILKAQMVKLDAETALLATMQYHTEKGEDGKTDRSKSRYRWLARVMKISDIQAKVMEMMQDANRMQNWKWWDDPSHDGCIYTSIDSSNYRAARFLNMKLKKMVDWDKGMMLFNGYKNAKKEYNLNAKYDLTGYTATNGDIVDLTDKDALLSHVNQNLWKEIIMKSKQMA